MIPDKAFLVALVFGLVAALRKEVPTIQGKTVWVLSLVLGLLVSVLDSGTLSLANLQGVLWGGFQVGAGAIAAASSVNYALPKFGGQS